MTTRAPDTLTVVVPAYNEEENILPFYERVSAALKLLPLRSYRILFVNNASADKTVEIVRGLNQKDGRVNILTLTRNFGYQAALVAGLSQQDSGLYAIIDVDGEDPPELLAEFYRRIQNGAHTAYGDRSQRDEPRLIVLGRWLFYWINHRIADAPVLLWMAEFSMFTKTVRDAILKNRTTYPFLRAELGFVGYRMEGVAYFRARRAHGRTHYNIFDMISFAVGGFLSSSTFPLRGIFYLAGPVGLLYAAALAYFKPSLAQAAYGAMLGSFLLLLVCLPIFALYLARIYKDVSGRPVYFVDEENSILS